jgi:hypothetical protein
MQITSTYYSTGTAVQKMWAGQHTLRLLLNYNRVIELPGRDYNRCRVRAGQVLRLVYGGGRHGWARAAPDKIVPILVIKTKRSKASPGVRKPRIYSR